MNLLSALISCIGSKLTLWQLPRANGFPEEDPQWSAQTTGVRLVPRPGKINAVDFAVIMTAEIDGTVYLFNRQQRARGHPHSRICHGDRCVGLAGPMEAMPIHRHSRR
jgi:hypothetical protein